MIRNRLFVSILTTLPLVGACLGGTGKPAGNDTPDGGGDVVAKCSAVMQNAPMGNWSYDDVLPTATHATWDNASIPDDGEADYPGGKYRSLTPDSDGKIHPGCSTDGLSYTPASIPGYPCAAKEYPFPSGVTEDTSKPIVLLIHGNSDSPSAWEPFLHPDPESITDFTADTEARAELSDKLLEQGYHTFAVDMRFDLNDDPPDADGGNPSRNFDHGWGVPIAQKFIKQMIIAYPDRHFAVIGHSLGATVARDALRRLWIQWKKGDWDINPFTRIDTVIEASGGNHGVSTYGLPGYCGQNFTMRGLAACQFGQRNTYSQVEFHKPLNGPAVPPEMTQAGEWGGWWETPCADGDYAFGTRGACGGHVVKWASVTMQDLPDGTQQDRFVSEHASRLYPEECADNRLDSLNDFDTSGYLANGLLRNHYGSVRSAGGQRNVLEILAE